MTDDDFYWVLKHVKLPAGELLPDNRTYRLTRKDFSKLDDVSRKALRNFWKMLILADGENHVAGGVLFYGSCDLHVKMLQKYKGKGYMSVIHRNGILRAELYPEQEVTISADGIESVDDFNMKCHLLSLIGLKAKNEDYIRENILPFYEDGTINVLVVPEGWRI